MDVTHRSFRLSAAKTSAAPKKQTKTANAVTALLKASPPIVGMALDAHLVGGLEMEEMLVFRTVCPVAARALQRDVSVPGVDDLLADRMRRMRLPLMARSTNIEERRLVPEEEAV